MLTRARNAAIVVASIAAVQLLPVSAYADTAPIVISLDGVTDQVSTCQLDSHYLNNSEVTATVDRKSNGEIDYTWHASPYAAVSSVDPCVIGIRVTTQLTDSTTMPNCPPVVQSPEFTATSNDPYVWGSTGRTDYEVADPADLEVPYFAAPGLAQASTDDVVNRLEMGDGAISDVNPLVPGCYRLRSTVTEPSTAYYETSAQQFIPYCKQVTAFEFVATPAGPEQVGDGILQSSSC